MCCPKLQVRKLQNVLEHVRLVLHEVRVEVEYFQPHVPTHLEPSLHTVFPRTLHHDLYETWVSAVVPPAATFMEKVKEFVAKFANAEARRELVNFINHPHKSRNMEVQELFDRLTALNNSVELLPGTTPKLDNDQLNAAFVDVMPQAWQQQFKASGLTLPGYTDASQDLVS
jgi:hypothetical protein